MCSGLKRNSKCCAYYVAHFFFSKLEIFVHDELLEIMIELEVLRSSDVSQLLLTIDQLLLLCIFDTFSFIYICKRKDRLSMNT